MAAWTDQEPTRTWDKPIHAGFSGAAVPKPRYDTPTCWEFFTVEALLELLADTSYELGRRGVRVLVG